MPTYHVCKGFVPFQVATLIPTKLQAGKYKSGDITSPQVDELAARAKDGHVRLALTNIDPNRLANVHVRTGGISAKSVRGEVLRARQVDTLSTFEAPNAVSPMPFGVEAGNGELMPHL